MKIFGNKKSFAIGYDNLDEAVVFGSLYLWILDENILEMELGNKKFSIEYEPLKCNVINIKKWFEKNLDFILTEKEFPVKNEEAKAQNWNGRNYYQNTWAKGGLTDEEYDKLYDWLSKHSWGSAVINDIIHDLFFINKDGVIEISWDGKNYLANLVRLKYVSGTVHANLKEFKEAIESFIKSLDLLLENKVKTEKIENFSIFMNDTKKTKELDWQRLEEILQEAENTEVDTKVEKLRFLIEIGNSIWDLSYYNIRNKETGMSVDGRYELGRIFEVLIKKFEIDIQKLMKFSDIKEITNQIEHLFLKAEISTEDFILSYNLISNFYKIIMDKISTENYYIWCDYKEKLSKSKSQESKQKIEEEYENKLIKCKEKMIREIEKFNNLLKEIGLI